MPCKIEIRPTFVGETPSIIIVGALEDRDILKKRLRVKKVGDAVHVSFFHGLGRRKCTYADPAEKELPYLEGEAEERGTTKKVRIVVYRQPKLYLRINAPLLGMYLSCRAEALVEASVFPWEKALPDLVIDMKHRATLTFKKRFKVDNMTIKLRKKTALDIPTLQTETLTCTLENKASCTIKELSTERCNISQAHKSKLFIDELHAKVQLHLTSAMKSEAFIETVRTPSLFIDCKQGGWLEISNIFTPRLEGELAQKATLLLYGGKIKVLNITKDAKSRFDQGEVVVGIGA